MLVNFARDVRSFNIEFGAYAPIKRELPRGVVQAIHLKEQPVQFSLR